MLLLCHWLISKAKDSQFQQNPGIWIVCQIIGGCLASGNGKDAPRCQLVSGPISGKEQRLEIEQQNK